MIFFFKETDTFIQKWQRKLIKNYSKAFLMLQQKLNLKQIFFFFTF